MTISAPRLFKGNNMLLAGALLMLGGDFMFALNDAMGKWLVASFSVGQVVMIRSIGAFIVLGPMLAGQGTDALFRIERPWAQFLRVAMATLDTVLFYAAVVYLPLADVMTFYMAGPIYVAALSHLLLGEKVGWRRWLAILIGFCGVVIALRPSSASLSWPSLFALAGSMSFALSIVLKLAWPSLPFIDRVGLVFLLALALAAVVSLATKPQQAGSDLIRTDDVDYSTSAGFNVAAIGVVAILAALYAIFW